MTATDTIPQELTLCIQKETLIAASREISFQAMLDQIGPRSETPDGTPMPLKLEPWPGGRWLRDLGDNTGHLWGHVQVIKPPTLLEITGPLFMSYPALNFVQYRLTEEGGGTRLALTHRAFGLISSEHREGVVMGWSHWLEKSRELAESRAKA